MKDTRKIKNYLVGLFLIFFCRSMSGQSNEPYSILLTGNTADYKEDKALVKQWEKALSESDKSAYLMLGNIYNPKNWNSKQFLKDTRHPLMLTPGQKEWANGQASGKEVIKSIEKIIQSEYQGTSFMPDAACPGPVEVFLEEHVVVILVDTYWWLHKHDRRFKKCGILRRSDVFVDIEDAVRRHYGNKHVVIAGHHSVMSYGNSGGYFSFKQSLLQAPYVLVRKLPGTKRDLKYPDFKEFRNAMLSLLESYPDIIYASAGDENLQYFTSNGAHHIISGSMVNTKYVKSNLPEFGQSTKGFAKLNFSPDGNCELVFIGEKGELFKKNIYSRKFISEQADQSIKLPSDKTAKASIKYNTKSSTFWMKGKNYRKVWNTPVTAPVFDIGKRKGGLKVIKRGGGMQTLSLRLEAKNGKQYVLRSLDKNMDGLIPVGFKKTFASDIVQDQVSTSNPYASLVVAKLAGYSGVFHTNPEVVYVPDDFRFGVYQKDVANKLFLFEERPDNDRSDIASFGRSQKIISTAKMLKKINKDENHFVDAGAYIRARLFDLLINDWDRHEDQWRWAGFKKGKQTIYKPIPRDRDQAFFVNQGLITWIAARKWLSPRFQNFDEFTENIPGLAFNARYLDRGLMIGSEWKDWKQQIDSLQMLLTPEEIDSAVLAYPKEIQPSFAGETAEILKGRLTNLEIMTRKLYLFLAKEVDITGTKRRDLFEIDIPNDTTASVRGYHLKADGQKGAAFFNRVFYSSETKRIRIYGFDGQDEFVFGGSGKSKIDIVIIGGKSKDKIEGDNIKKKHSITIYDKKNTEVSKSLSSRLKSNYAKAELKFDREHFLYDVVIPVVSINYNQDDGLFMGGGAIYKKYSRYHTQKYKAVADYAIATNSYKLSFSGKNTYPLKRFEWSFLGDFHSPNYMNNYFGLGNETSWKVDKSNNEYYWVRMRKYFGQTSFTKFLDKDGANKMGLSFFYKNMDVSAPMDRFITEFAQNNLSTTDLQMKSYVGSSIHYTLDTKPKEAIKEEDEFVGSQVFPRQGMQLKAQFDYFKGLENGTSDFTKLSGEWSSYLSFTRRPRVVYAFRVGGEKLFGDYFFAEAAKLGQKQNLRGFRLTRYYGDASLYMNVEIRIRLKEFRSHVLTGNAGMLLFNDVGRVWLDREQSSLWHNGVGAGFWFAPFDLSLMTLSYTHSDDDNLIMLSQKFQF